MTHWLLWLILAQGADVVTTWQNVRAGCQEQVWSSATAATTGKVGATIVLTVTLPKLARRGHPHLAKIIAGLGVSSGVISATVNLAGHRGCQQIRDARKGL